MDVRPGSLDLVDESGSCKQGVLVIQFRKLELSSGESGSPADSGVLSAIEEHHPVSAGSLNRLHKSEPGSTTRWRTSATTVERMAAGSERNFRKTDVSCKGMIQL